ncbi:MAG: RNA-binding protein [Bacteroidetes bacterium]|nr:MAG: RNA-binding protein [Bacteroidota bacterium]
MKFQLNGQAYIELNKLLKIMGIVESGGFANAVITGEEVLVNGQIETRKRKKLHQGDTVTFANHTIEIVA